MNVATEQELLTPEDLLALPDGGNGYELADGKLVERHMGLWSSAVGARLARRLGEHCDEYHLGWVFGAEAGYQCFSGRPSLVRNPDVSFIRFGRLLEERVPEGHARIFPDLTVEVVSPNDTV